MHPGPISSIRDPFLSTQTIISLPHVRTQSPSRWSVSFCSWNIRFWEKPNVLLLLDISRVMFGGGNQQLLVYLLIAKWTFHLLSPFLINAYFTVYNKLHSTYAEIMIKHILKSLKSLLHFYFINNSNTFTSWKLRPYVIDFSKCLPQCSETNKCSIKVTWFNKHFRCNLKRRGMASSRGQGIWKCVASQICRLANFVYEDIVDRAVSEWNVSMEIIAWINSISLALKAQSENLV